MLAVRKGGDALLNSQMEAESTSELPRCSLKHRRAISRLEIWHTAGQVYCDAWGSSPRSISGQTVVEAGACAEAHGRCDSHGSEIRNFTDCGDPLY